jgi:hypothetical protein
MRLRTHYNSFTIIAALLTVVFFTAWGVLIYRGYSIKAEIAATAGATENAQAKSARLLSLKNTVRDLKDDIEVIEDRFIAKDGIPAFIDMLDTQAEKAGVKININSINLDENDPLLQTLKIHMTGSGSWEGAVRLIDILEKLPYALEIKNLSFQKSNEDDKNAGMWNWNANIEVKVANKQ